MLPYVDSLQIRTNILLYLVVYIKWLIFEMSNKVNHLIKNIMETKVKEILTKVLPKEALIIVQTRNYALGSGQYLKIAIAANDVEINNVRGQFPQCVSLSLNLSTLLLEVQVYGCSGGQRVYLVPDLNHPKEKYLAMAGRRVAFRKPKQEEKFVLNAIKRFAENWLKTLKENEARLFHSNIVDYTTLLKDVK